MSETAGPELDALIAVEVMGWVLGEGPISHYLWCVTQHGTSDLLGNFRPSTDIAAAWEVVEKTGLLSDAYEGHGWILWHDLDGWIVGDLNLRTVARGDTAPLAICLAALEAQRKQES